MSDVSCRHWAEGDYQRVTPDRPVHLVNPPRDDEITPNPKMSETDVSFLTQENAARDHPSASVRPPRGWCIEHGPKACWHNTEVNHRFRALESLALGIMC